MHDRARLILCEHLTATVTNTAQQALRTTLINGYTSSMPEAAGGSHTNSTTVAAGSGNETAAPPATQRRAAQVYIASQEEIDFARRVCELPAHLFKKVVLFV